jgi:hypothetical protein
MVRVPLPTPEALTGAAGEVYDRIAARRGVPVENIFLALLNAPDLADGALLTWLTKVSHFEGVECVSPPPSGRPSRRPILGRVPDDFEERRRGAPCWLLARPGCGTRRCRSDRSAQTRWLGTLRSPRCWTRAIGPSLMRVQETRARSRAARSTPI